jgi:D-alanyl-D-alanine carboxypeptidase
MPSLASTSIVVDVDSGNVLFQDNATVPWFPASTTKLMTVYVALSAVREGRITLETPLMVSPRAASKQPSKMGFRPGTLVTLDNALKMLMVKSPNDVAVTIAEGVDGSVEAFANDMNVYATRLGLHESHFVNPNGLPDSRHVSSARDMAIIGRALLHDFPEEKGLFGIGVLEFGGHLINNHNGMLGRYPGADGMKTGFTCAAGYNLVASAERDGRHLITVIMGAPSTRERNERAAALFDRFFASNGAPSLGQPDSLPGSGITTAPDNHETVCGRGKYAAIAEAEAEDTSIPLSGQNRPNLLMAMAGQAGTVPGAAPGTGMSGPRAYFEPVHVYIGPAPGWSGRIAQAVGGGAKEFNVAPVKQTAAAERAAVAPPDGNGPIESAAPAPLALLGATPVAPAALATKRFVRGTPSLSLAVGSIPRGRHRVAKGAVVAKPKVVASAEVTPAAKPAKGKKPVAVKTAAASLEKKKRAAKGSGKSP